MGNPETRPELGKELHATAGETGAPAHGSASAAATSPLCMAKPTPSGPGRFILPQGRAVP